MSKLVKFNVNSSDPKKASGIFPFPNENRFLLVLRRVHCSPCLWLFHRKQIVKLILWRMFTTTSFTFRKFRRSKGRVTWTVRTFIADAGCDFAFYSDWTVSNFHPPLHCQMSDGRKIEWKIFLFSRASTSSSSSYVIGSGALCISLAPGMGNFHRFRARQSTDESISRRHGSCVQSSRDWKNKQNRWHSSGEQGSTNPIIGRGRAKQIETSQFSPFVSDPGRPCWRRDMSRGRSAVGGFRPATAPHTRSSRDRWCCRLWAPHRPIGSGRLESHHRRQPRRRWFQHQAGRSPTWRFVYTASRCLICTRR